MTEAEVERRHKVVEAMMDAGASTDELERYGATAPIDDGDLETVTTSTGHEVDAETARQLAMLEKRHGLARGTLTIALESADDATRGRVIALARGESLGTDAQPAPEFSLEGLPIPRMFSESQLRLPGEVRLEDVIPGERVLTAEEQIANLEQAKRAGKLVIVGDEGTYGRLVQEIRRTAPKANGQRGQFIDGLALDSARQRGNVEQEVTAGGLPLPRW